MLNKTVLCTFLQVCLEPKIWFSNFSTASLLQTKKQIPLSCEQLYSNYSCYFITTYYNFNHSNFDRENVCKAIY